MYVLLQQSVGVCSNNTLRPHRFVITLPWLRCWLLTTPTENIKKKVAFAQMINTIKWLTPGNGL